MQLQNIINASHDISFNAVCALGLTWVGMISFPSVAMVLSIAEVLGQVWSSVATMRYGCVKAKMSNLFVQECMSMLILVGFVSSINVLSKGRVVLLLSVIKKLNLRNLKFWRKKRA